MKKNNITWLANCVSFLIMLAVFLPLISFAQIKNPLKDVGSIEQFVSVILGYVVKIGGVIAVFAFIYVGYLFVAARGNKEELNTAKSAFLNTVIGVALLLGAQLVSTMIVSTIEGLK